MSSGQRDQHPDVVEVRDIHALAPPPPPPAVRGRLGELWDSSSSSRSSTLSLGSDENFTTMSREFSALVVAGSTMQRDSPAAAAAASSDPASLGRIGEEEPLEEETNPLAIVPDPNPIASPRRRSARGAGPSAPSDHNSGSDVSASFSAAAAAGEGGASSSVHSVKKEEVESKIGAWQTAEIAKINNRFKREDVVINGWESEQVEKATAVLKKTEEHVFDIETKSGRTRPCPCFLVPESPECMRRLEEKRARAMEKMQNEVAKARQKAEERRASAEAKRGTKVAKVLELSNLLRAVGRAPSKRSIFF